MIAKRMEIIKWTTNRVRLADCAFSFSTPENVNAERGRKGCQGRICTAERCRDDTDCEEDQDRMSQYAGGAEHWEDIVVQCGQFDLLLRCKRQQ